jgi:hypothetical protein
MFEEAAICKVILVTRIITRGNSLHVEHSDQLFWTFPKTKFEVGDISMMIIMDNM